MNIRAITVAAVALSVLSSPGVKAADITVPDSFDWTGPYVGIQGGYALGTSRHYTVAIPATTASFDTGGLVGGATIGFNTQMNNVVLGLEGDASLAGINGVTGNAPGWGCLDGCQTSIDWFATARARAGVAL